MGKEGETSTFATEAAQATTNQRLLCLYLGRCISFEDLVDRRLEPLGAPSHFYMPDFIQHMVSSLVETLQINIEVLDMVRPINSTFHFFGSFQRSPSIIVQPSLQFSLLSEGAIAC